MASANYNEVANCVITEGDWNTTIDPLYHFDTHYPESLSMNSDYMSPRRKPRRQRSRHGLRYKTQPITFDEIKEVDEVEPSDGTKESLKNTFTAFSRSMEGLVRGNYPSNSPSPTAQMDTDSSAERIPSAHASSEPDETGDDGTPLGSSPSSSGMPDLVRIRRKKKSSFRNRNVVEGIPEQVERGNVDENT